MIFKFICKYENDMKFDKLYDSDGSEGEVREHDNSCAEYEH